MRNAELTDDDLSYITRALRKVADLDKENAATLRREDPGPPLRTGVRTTPAVEHLAQQFDRQSSDARKLADRLEDLPEA